jgi:hypothetical protein
VASRVGEADTGDDKCGQQSRAEQSDCLAHLPGPPEIELTAQNDLEGHYPVSRFTNRLTDQSAA